MTPEQLRALDIEIFKLTHKIEVVAPSLLTYSPVRPSSSTSPDGPVYHRVYTGPDGKKGKWYHTEEDSPHYSTDIADAWRLVELVYEWKFILDMFEGLSGVHYNARFIDDGKEYIGEDITAPLAIALAARDALKASKA